MRCLPLTCQECGGFFEGNWAEEAAPTLDGRAMPFVYHCQGTCQGVFIRREAHAPHGVSLMNKIATRNCVEQIERAGIVV